MNRVAIEHLRRTLPDLLDPKYQHSEMNHREAINALCNLAMFGRACLDEHRSELGDLDGGWLQERAEACGLFVRVTVT